MFLRRNRRQKRGVLHEYWTLVMWRCLEMWLAGKRLGHCARQVIEQTGTIHSTDVVLPVKDKADVRLRLVAKPEKLAADLLAHMGLQLPTRPKTIQNVVETFEGQ